MPSKNKTAYIRVTEVLSVLERYSGVPQSRLEDRGEQSTEIHKYSLAYAKGLYLPSPPHVAPWLETFVAYFEDDIAEVLCVEQELRDEAFRVIGHVDLIARRKRERKFRVLDLKRTAAIDWIMGLQLAKYEDMAEKKYRRRFGTKAAIWMPEPGKIKLMPFPNKDDLASFMCAYHLFNYRAKYGL